MPELRRGGKLMSDLLRYLTALRDGDIKAYHRTIVPDKNYA